MWFIAMMIQLRRIFMAAQLAAIGQRLMIWKDLENIFAQDGKIKNFKQPSKNMGRGFRLAKYINP